MLVSGFLAVKSTPDVCGFVHVLLFASLYGKWGKLDAKKTAECRISHRIAEFFSKDKLASPLEVKFKRLRLIKM